MGCGTVGSPTDVHGRRRLDSSTTGSPTGVQGGRGGTTAPPDRRLLCLRVGNVFRRVADRLVGRKGRGGQATTACARVCTPLPRGMPQG